MSESLNKKKINWAPYILIAPTVILFACLLLYPLGNVFYLSFQNKLLSRPKLDGFAGLANFITLFTDDPVFWEAFLNSMKWVVAEVGLQFVFGLGIALLLKERFRGCGIFRAILFLPWALSGVLVSMLWSMMYFENVGVLNDLFQRLGIISEPVAWTGNINTSFWAVVVAELWRGIPFIAIMILASLQAIPDELYEACRVDGGGRIMSFRHITFPYIKETAVLTTLLRVVWEFNSVDLILNLTGGGPIHKTTTLAVYLANTARRDGNFGYGSSIAVVSFFILLVFAFFYLKLSNYGKEENAV